MIAPTFTTAATDELCNEVAKKSKGVCFLGFSRGKDSLCSWLSLTRYFKRIIPFHCASWPGMDYVKKTLDYYQYEMNTRILRMNGEDYPMALVRMMYQPYKDCQDIEEWELDDYSKLDVLEYLRHKFGLPNAWCAFGISASDSIDRRIYCKNTGGKNPQNKTFYPCWDWPRTEIIKAVKESGLKLTSEYRYVNRTMGNVPGIVTNEILKAHYPKDWERFLCLYPLAEAKTVRERILDREWAAAKKRKIEENGGTAADHEPGNGVEDSPLPLFMAPKGDGEDEYEDDTGYSGAWMEDTGDGE